MSSLMDLSPLAPGVTTIGTCVQRIDNLTADLHDMQAHQPRWTDSHSSIVSFAESILPVERRFAALDGCYLGNRPDLVECCIEISQVMIWLNFFINHLALRDCSSRLTELAAHVRKSYGPPNWTNNPFHAPQHPVAPSATPPSLPLVPAPGPILLLDPSSPSPVPNTYFDFPELVDPDSPILFNTHDVIYLIPFPLFLLEVLLLLLLVYPSRLDHRCCNSHACAPYPPQTACWGRRHNRSSRRPPVTAFNLEAGFDQRIRSPIRSNSPVAPLRHSLSAPFLIRSDSRDLTQQRSYAAVLSAHLQNQATMLARVNNFLESTWEFAAPCDLPANPGHDFRDRDLRSGPSSGLLDPIGTFLGRCNPFPLSLEVLLIGSEVDESRAAVALAHLTPGNVLINLQYVMESSKRTQLLELATLLVKIKPSPFWPTTIIGPLLAQWIGMLHLYLVLPGAEEEDNPFLQGRIQDFDSRFRTILVEAFKNWDVWRNYCVSSQGKGRPLMFTLAHQRCDKISKLGYRDDLAEFNLKRFQFATLENYNAPFLKRPDPDLRFSRQYLFVHDHHHCCFAAWKMRLLATAQLADVVYWLNKLKFVLYQKHLIDEVLEEVWFEGFELVSRSIDTQLELLRHAELWTLNSYPTNTDFPYFNCEFPSLRPCDQILVMGIPNSHDPKARHWPVAVHQTQLDEYFGAVLDAALSLVVHHLLSIIGLYHHIPLPFCSLPAQAVQPIPINKSSATPAVPPLEELEDGEVRDAVASLTNPSFSVLPLAPSILTIPTAPIDIEDTVVSPARSSAPVALSPRSAPEPLFLEGAREDESRVPSPVPSLLPRRSTSLDAVVPVRVFDDEDFQLDLPDIRSSIHRSVSPQGSNITAASKNPSPQPSSPGSDFNPDALNSVFPSSSLLKHLLVSPDEAEDVGASDEQDYSEQ
ncbi:hypothetical protein C8J56DRAFT_889000 [Mycena floridula]|nr:hypothetical protein C8J56DRAFT_889000 [Mycena floridula]